MAVKRAEIHATVTRLLPILTDDHIRQLHDLIYSKPSIERTRMLVAFAEEIKIGNLKGIDNPSDLVEFLLLFLYDATRALCIRREGLTLGTMVHYHGKVDTITKIATDFTLRLKNVTGGISPLNVQKV